MMVKDFEFDENENPNFIDACKYDAETEAGTVSEKQGMYIKGRDVIHLDALEVFLSKDTPLPTKAQDLAGAIKELFQLEPGGGDEDDNWEIPEMPEPNSNEIYVLFDSLLNPAPEIAGKDNIIWLSLRGFKSTESIDFGDGNIFYSDSPYVNGQKYTYTTSGTYLVKLTASKEMASRLFLYNCSDSGYGSIRAIKIGSDINISGNDRPFTSRGNYDNIGLEYIKFNHMESAAAYEFNNCNNLRTVELYNCKSLGSDAFRYCYNLRSVELPKCTEVGRYAFVNCNNLKSAKLPMCTTLGDSAFYNCYKLKTLEMPNCISVGNNAFSNCNFQSLELSSCESIGEGAFADCHQIQQISLPNCIVINGFAFSGCHSLKSASFPNVTSLADRVFYNCSKLETVDLPNCTSIGDYAFQNCSNLKYVKLPKCTSMGQDVFEKCGSLRELILPN